MLRFGRLCVLQVSNYDRSCNTTMDRLPPSLEMTKQEYHLTENSVFICCSRFNYSSINRFGGFSSPVIARSRIARQTRERLARLAPRRHKQVQASRRQPSADRAQQGSNQAATGLQQGCNGASNSQVAAKRLGAETILKTDNFLITMDIIRRPMRYSHTEGHTDVCYSDDGKYVITCGNDGDVRIWCGLEDDDPNSQCVGEHAYAVAFKDKQLFVATDTNKVQAYTFPNLEKDGIVCKFTAPATHIAVDKYGKKLISGSRDMTIQVYDRSSSEFNSLSGHAAPLLGVAVDPELKYLASSSCDGTVRIWSLDTLKCIKIWSCLPESNSFNMAQCLGRTSWHPVSGKYIAVPENLNIDLYKKDTWEKMVSFSHDRVQKSFSITLFSPCGQYLAASTVCGEICVWDVNKAICVSYTEHSQQSTITAMAWNPINNGTIAFCDATGQLGTIEGCLSSVGPEERNEDDAMSLKLPVDDGDEDNENVISLEKIKSSVSQPLGNFDLETDALSAKDDDDDDAESKASFGSPSFKIQSPFQPSSSPVNLQHRYMVWNSVGIIRCFNTEEENSIDIEFHDSSLHHAIHMNNYLKHSLASLSETALLLSCEAGQEMPSKIVCVLLNSWDGTREWSMELPEGEEVLAVACSKEWVAVATDVRNLRFFSIAGAQREIISLPGPVVCLAAQEKLLLVTYHHGPGLNCILLAVERQGVDTVLPSQPVALAPESILQWAGFSDEGTPCIMDSAGILRILSTKGYWLPACNTQSHCKGMSDHYFVIGVSEKYQNLRCILCKGSHYPLTTPRPTVIELPMKVPLCDASSEKSNLEEIFWRTQIVYDTLDSNSKIDINYAQEKENAEKTIKETIIKLFALACRSGLEQRALDLCKMMSSTQIVQLAMKYASKLGKHQLCERIGDISSEARLNNLSQLTETHSRFMTARKFSTYKQETVREKKKEDVIDIYPFSSSQESTGKENILLALKEKLNSPVNAPPSVSQKKVNPFKKNINTGGLSPQGDLSGRKDANSEGKIQTSLSSSSAVITKSKQTGLWGKTPNTGGPSNKGLTFVQWFSKEKENLQEEFPDMDTTALTRTAMKRFKQEVLKKDTGTKTKENLQTSVVKNSQTSVSENAPSSLSDKSQNLSENTQTDLAHESVSEEISDSTRGTESSQEAKKRKLVGTEVSEESSASKLAKFAFKK